MGPQETIESRRGEGSHVIWDVERGGWGPRMHKGQFVVYRFSIWASVSACVVILASMLGMTRPAQRVTHRYTLMKQPRGPAIEPKLATFQDAPRTCTHGDRHIDHTVSGGGDEQEHHLDSHADNGC